MQRLSFFIITADAEAAIAAIASKKKKKSCETFRSYFWPKRCRIRTAEYQGSPRVLWCIKFGEAASGESNYKHSQRIQINFYQVRCNTRINLHLIFLVVYQFSMLCECLSFSLCLCLSVRVNRMILMKTAHMRLLRCSLKKQNASMINKRKKNKNERGENKRIAFISS